MSMLQTYLDTYTSIYLPVDKIIVNSHGVENLDSDTAANLKQLCISYEDSIHGFISTLQNQMDILQKNNAHYLSQHDTSTIYNTLHEHLLNHSPSSPLHGYMELKQKVRALQLGHDRTTADIMSHALDHEQMSHLPMNHQEEISYREQLTSLSVTMENQLSHANDHNQHLFTQFRNLFSLSPQYLDTTSPHPADISLKTASEEHLKSQSLSSNDTSQNEDTHPTTTLSSTSRPSSDTHQNK